MTRTIWHARVPGFTAEHSLEAVVTSSAGSPVAGRSAPARGSVTPQASVLRDSSDCIPNCMCITGEDCPCCLSATELSGLVNGGRL